ncbi:MAG: ABC transporter substrate-binding protein [Candidatus Tectomicrobia bacterium]|nr:ABC transporter substrate-binding protein [Candidatus Tectomicrobia bacterium]
MKHFSMRTALVFGLAAALALAGFSATADAAPKKGGILKYIIPAEPPSYDGHRETTFGLIHPIAPFYSLLIRVNPDNPASPTDFVCDVCTEMPKPTDGGKKYAFQIRKDVKFWDGQPLNAHDVVATWNKIVFPPKGVASAREGQFRMVSKIHAVDDHTAVFELKFPSGAFLPALAAPYNFLYSAKKLAQDMHWYEKNILGSGPFKFKQHQRGAFIEGERNPEYFHKGMPYLDGFHGIFSDKLAVRVNAIRSGQAFIEFRGFPPSHRDDLKKPFDDVRVRRALTLAIDRWGGSQFLSKTAIVKTVGGVVFPGHPLAAKKAELEKIAGYWPDLKKSRAEAKKLLAEAGFPNGFEFTLHNRGVDQPYKIVGTWLIDQWRQVGLKVKQWVQPTGPFYQVLRSKSQQYDVSMDFNCQAVVNPLVDVFKYLSYDRSGSNHANYINRKVDELFDKMNRTGDIEEQQKYMRAFEKIVLDEEAHYFVTLWWYRIIPHRSIVKGWKISPSHYLNQDLSNIWLEE